jgi:hypothetical protein
MRSLVLIALFGFGCSKSDTPRPEPAPRNTAADPPQVPIDPGRIEPKLPPDFPIKIPAEAWISSEHDQSDAGGEYQVGINLPGEAKAWSAHFKAVLEQAGFDISWVQECAMEDPSEWAYGMRCELAARSTRGSLRVTVKKPVSATDSYISFYWRKK